MVSSFEETNVQNLLEKIAKDEGFLNPKFSISCATNPGENFMCQVSRVKIEDPDQKKSLSLIFKVSSPNEARKEMLRRGDVFRIESEMYQTVLPALNDLLKNRGLSNSPIFPGTARCYATLVNSSTDESDVIVLEDKKVNGYSIGSVRDGLDRDQCRLALQRVALLHSSFIALRALEPETADRISKILDRTVWSKDDPIITDFRQGYRTGLESLGEPYSPGDPTYQKLYKIYEDFGDVFTFLTKVPDDLSCIGHGDFWANNVLCKLNQDGVAEDACVIDFQLSRLQSPVIDLLYFLFICTTKELRDQCFDELIQIYYDELTKTLLDCGCNPESVAPWTTFLKHFQDYGKVGVIAAVGSLPVLMADKSDVKENIHSLDDTAVLFAGTAKITDPETLKDLTERLNGIVENAEEWGYI